MEPKYIIAGHAIDRDEEANGLFPFAASKRVTGEFFATIGRGEYTTYRPDGQALRTYIVRLNRKGTLSVESEKATGLAALSTLNLERLIKRFDGIVKIWPAGGLPQVRKVQAEIERRKVLIDAVIANSSRVDALLDPVEEAS